MLPKEHRLTNEKDIKTLFNKGRASRGSVFALRVRKNGSAYSRFSVIAGVKVHKSAVKRNQLRRRMRAIIQEELPSLASGFDVAVVMYTSALEKKSAELHEAFLQTAKKAGLV